MLVDLAALSIAGRWLVGWLLLWRVPPLPGRTLAASPRPSGPARVSVIVPARDEAATLPRLLAGLAGQTRPADEIVVVDDDSSDGTAAVAAAAGATVVTSEPLPPGWTGKTWACWQGTRTATGDLLVFLDADTEPEPELLDRLVATWSERGGVVSVQPWHRMERSYERASAFFNLIAWMGVGAGSFRRRARVTGAFGPCVAVSRADYERTGGHAGVRGAVLEDVALARAAERAGIAVWGFGGRGTVRFRMYPHGPGQLAEGWSKNFAAGASSTPFVRLVGVVAWLSVVFAVGWSVTAGTVALAFGGSGPSTGTLVAYAAIAGQLAWMLRRLGNFGITAWVFPVAALAFLAVFARSLLWAARGEVQWKGRVIPVRGAGA